MKRRNLKKLFVIGCMSLGLMIGSLGMTANAAYATLSKYYSSGKGTVTLCNRTQVYRFGEVKLEQYNIGHAREFLGRSWGRINSGERVSVTKPITKTKAIGSGILHETSSLDSRPVFEDEIMVK